MMADPFRSAARAYFVYGVVLLVGGLYLVYHGVGVMGGQTGGATTREMLRWGLVGLIPLTAVPWLLAHRWSWLRGWISRRTFAGLVAIFVTIRAFKVAVVAIRGGASVPAPWGGEISYQLGAAVFLPVILAALVFVARAAWQGDTA